MVQQQGFCATVIKHTGSHYLVSRLPQWEPVSCTVRGKIRLKGSRTTNPIAVGDLVDVEPAADGTAVITGIAPRKNYIIRRATNLSRQSHVIAANIDCAYLVLTLKYPQTPLEFVDRFLATCEAYSVPAVLLLNKSDILRDEVPEALARCREIYEGVGYKVWEVSALTGEGMEALREAIRGQVALFSGVSGVGKSSIINTLDPQFSLRTGEISDYHLKGKHTTTFYEMFPVAGGFVIDSPGIKGFGLVDVAREEVYHFFPELFKYAEACRFQPCTHTHEPDCAVLRALEQGLVSEERYESYLKLLDEEGGKYR